MVSLLAGDRSILHKLRPLVNSKKYQLINVMITTVDYERLRKSEAVFLDASLDKNQRRSSFVLCGKLPANILFSRPADIAVPEEGLTLGRSSPEKGKHIQSDFIPKIH